MDDYSHDNTWWYIGYRLLFRGNIQILLQYIGAHRTPWQRQKMDLCRWPAWWVEEVQLNQYRPLDGPWNQCISQKYSNYSKYLLGILIFISHLILASASNKTYRTIWTRVLLITKNTWTSQQSKRLKNSILIVPWDVFFCIKSLHRKCLLNTTRISKVIIARNLILQYTTNKPILPSANDWSMLSCICRGHSSNQTT